MQKMIGQPGILKKVNADMIKQIITVHGPISKPEIAKLTKLSLPTVNKIVEVLVQEDQIVAAGLEGSSSGRKAQLYKINANQGYVAAIYVKDNLYICGISTFTGEIIERNTYVYDEKQTISRFEDLLRVIELLTEKVGRDKLKAIGIGVPGAVDVNDTVYSIPTIPEWESFPMREEIEKRYDIPVFVENDINLTTVGYFSTGLEGRGENMMYIYLGQGIGAGLIIHKKLYKGMSNFAGELSYMVVDGFDSNTPQEWKLKGLLERQLDQAGGNKDKVANIIFKMCMNVVSIINPECIVLTGAMANGEIVRSVEKSLSDSLHPWNLPQLVYLQNPDPYSIQGIVSMCLSHIDSQIQLVNRQGI